MSFLSQIHTLSPALYRTSFAASNPTAMSTEREKGPTQTSMEDKITKELNPTFLELVNESHLHAHHAAMKGNTNKETHFKVTVVSEAFQGKTLMQRHRIIYNLLDDELKNKGLHALTLKTKTPTEFDKETQ